MQKFIGRKTGFKRSHRSFLNLNDRFVLGYGILIEQDGTVHWSRDWSHSYTKAFLLEDHGCLLTDEVYKTGPIAIFPGTYAFELEDGSLRWKLDYDKLKEDMRKIFNKVNNEHTVIPSMRREKTDGQQLITVDLVVDFYTGEYEARKGHTFDQLRKLSSSSELQYPSVYLLDMKHDLLHGNAVPEAGYLRNDLVAWKAKDHFLLPIYPVRSTDEKAQLLAMSREEGQIEMSWDLPVGGQVLEVAPFLEEGLIVHQYSGNRFYLTLIRTEVML